MNPVVISKQNPTTFSDKSQIWADNAQSSPFFGSVYVCWADFRSNSQGPALPVPLIVARSADGGSTWTLKQVGPATSNGINSQPDGCTVRTDSHGNVYVFGVGTRGGASFEMMYKSTDGGAHFTGPALLASAVDPGVIDPVIGRPVMDGIAGARNDLAFAPSADIANGAPTGDRRDQPDRADLGRRRARAQQRAAAADDLHRRRRVVQRADRGAAHRGGPAVLHRAGDLAQRHRRVHHLQRVHHPVPQRHQFPAGPGRRDLARRRDRRDDRRVRHAGPRRGR